MKDIKLIHDEVFNYLYNWSIQSRNNTEEINPFFYIRSVRDEYFKKGYWFPGNSSNLCISFWAGGDSINKTPNVFFEIHETYGCRIVIVGKDSPSKYSYLKLLVAFLNKHNTFKYVIKRNENIWVRQLSKRPEDWINKLNIFIDKDKRRIDEYLKLHEPSESEEFVTKFGFITSWEFNDMYSRVLVERESLNKDKLQKHFEFLQKDKLPFSLLGISIANFQGIKNTEISDLRPDARWIFVTGENGYGKTSLLQAIALGLCTDPDLEKYSEQKTRISAKIQDHNKIFFSIREKGSFPWKNNNDLAQYVLGYGPARLNIQAKGSENDERRSTNSVQSLFEYETLLKNINYELFASKYSDSKMFDDLKQIIRTVTGGRITDIEVIGRDPWFVETLSNDDRLEPMPLSNLAAGFRSIINLVFDIYLRFRDIHPNMVYSDYYGLVLIDEIENHLHPILQRELPIKLSEVFPDIQFIVSTHSPIPLLGAEKNSIILKVNRMKDEGICIERLDETVDFPNLLPNTILTSPIFGFEGIFAESKNDNDFVRAEDDYNEVLNNDEQKNKIEKYLNNKTTSEILKLLKKK